uniref:BTB domain-containing protein n=1 Tax=Panagrolaimus sp. ES5 TaxID=591445 RepID=A0AC34FFQ9_9BILA
MKGDSEKEIEIPDFDFETVEKAVNLCYHRSLVKNEITTDGAILLLKFAAIYDIATLKENLELYLVYDIATLKENLELYLGDKLTVFNICEIVKIAKETKASKLEKKCFDFLIENIGNKKFIPNMDQLDEKFAHELLQKSMCMKSKTYLCKEIDLDNDE